MISLLAHSLFQCLRYMSGNNAETTLLRKLSVHFLDQMSVEASRTVHIGDDQKADKQGANSLGIDCWSVPCRLIQTPH